MQSIPKDPFMLLSYINTQLRDYYPSLEELCRSLDLEKHDIMRTLSAVSYEYSPERNQFL